MSETARLLSKGPRRIAAHLNEAFEPVSSRFEAVGKSLSADNIFFLNIFLTLPGFGSTPGK